MQSSSTTVGEYLEALPMLRQQPMREMLAFIRKHMPAGYEEGMQWGMICYYIPLKIFPATYNKQPLCYLGLASQKNYMSLYLMAMNGQEEHGFREAYAQTGKKLDMGKSCLRFKKTDDLALEVIGKAIAKYDADSFIAAYQTARGNR